MHTRAVRLHARTQAAGTLAYMQLAKAEGEVISLIEGVLLAANQAQKANISSAAPIVL